MGEDSHGVRIETERLVLRRYRAGDHDCVHRLASEPAIFRYSHHGPLSSEESWSMLLRHNGFWEMFGWGVFAVEEKESGDLVGQAGLSDFRRLLGRAFDPFPEITWSFEPRTQGRGYATEAARAALEWIERAHGVRRTVCLIHDANRASLRVAEKLGYREFDRREYRGYPAILFAREGGARLHG
ncbi:MAG: GNAT family N-acetyltransferase [Pseudomonadota bacterium]|nr:GNAT family N-acetyltransferase [Pseudomonadota bacterium]